MEGDGRHVVYAFYRLLIQSFNIAKCMSKAQAGDTHLVSGQSVEHECIVGIWTVSDGNLASVGRRTAVRVILGFYCDAHTSTLLARRKRTATAAAAITFITSANTNQ